ncbi:MAG: DUF4097 family beta strand repeat protein [Sedimentisphaerales bacterium]|nr:DUF4097 family beta strand repeat protein [Sedimentisphaerales bacterium]
MRPRNALQQTVSLAAMLLVGAGLIHIAGCYPQAEFEKMIELEHPMEASSTLAVSTASGSIDVAGGQTERCHVIATIRARAATEEEAQELAEQVEIRIEPSPGKLQIKADRPRSLRNKSLSISYSITVPHETHVECSSASGSVDLADLTGNVNADAASGSVEAVRITGSVRLHTASGSVRAEEVRGGDAHLNSASGSVRLLQASEMGRCELHAASGRVAAEHIDADSVSLHTASGSVHLTEARAPSVSLSTSSGSIRAEGLNASQVKAESPSGGISVAFAPAAPGEITADLKTSSGNVTLALPPDFAGRIDLSAGSGSVHTDLPISITGKIDRKHISGTVGQGAGNVSVHTSSGSIRVK